MAVLSMMAAYCCVYKKEHKKLPGWMISGVVWMGIGYLSLMAAPGNFNRYGMSVGNQPITHFWLDIVFNAFKCGYKYVKNAGILMAIVLILIMMARRLGEKAVYKLDNMIFLIGTVVSVAVMAVMPVCPERVFIHSVVLLIILLFSLWERMKLEKEKKIGLIAVLCCIVSVYACYVFDAVGDVLQIKRYYDGVVARILETKEKGEEEVLIESPPKPSTKYGITIYFDEDAQKWPNYYWASYYGIDRISIEKSHK